MAENKTKETETSVSDFIQSLPDEKKRTDCAELIEIMSLQTGSGGKMWGSNIVGFGSYHYKYESGREGDAPLVAFSPRTDAFSLYLDPDFPSRETLLAKFGKHKVGKGCVYIKKLEDIDKSVLASLISDSVSYIQSKYPAAS